MRTSEVKMRHLVISCFLVLACLPEQPVYQNNYARITNYPIQTDKITSRGVRLDQSGFVIDLIMVDAVIDQAERCLAKNFEAIALFCEQEKMVCQEIMKNNADARFWKCYDLMTGCNKYQRTSNGFDRSMFRVKIAPDWHYACNGQTMVFPCGVDPAACLAKGLEPTVECPCSCRSTIQDSDIITTPQLVILAGELIRLATGFNNPWNVPMLESCANISP